MRALLLIAVVGIGAAQTSPAQPAGPPATDIYLFELTGGLASLKDAKQSPIATMPGYENQPMFSPDGRRILYAANIDGKQIDVFVFDRDTGFHTLLTRTAENENSPTYLPSGTGAFSVVRTEADRTQRLWRFDAQGDRPELVLPGVKPVGYHTWVDGDTVALYVLGQPATLQIATIGTGKAEIVAEAIGRSLHHVPGTRAVSFVQRDATGEYWVKEIDVNSKSVQTLVKAAEGSADRDMTWMPDGKTLLMSAGTKVFSWTRGETGWTEVFDAARRGLGPVSRLTVSPKGDAVAIVVAEPR